MCGIIGIFNMKKGPGIPRSIIKDMTNSMTHRGPDDSGTFTDENIGLGFRRLAIIDLSKKANQPMTDSKKQTYLVFNGEIYNFQEIREELKSKGHKFKSKSDTEVILNSYLEWGIECLEKFNGMFGLAIYDKKRKELFVARDRLGIKPLFYSQIDSHFMFSSEIKGILMHPDFKREPNVRAISSYLSYRYVLGEETLFKHIYKVKPGYYLHVKDGKIYQKKYYELPVRKQEDEGLEYYTKAVNDLLTDSIKKRMISDVPFGAYLSGGLDSSIIAAVMAKSEGSRIKTFTIGFQEEGYNEFAYSEMVAQKYNTLNKQIILSARDYLKTMDKLIGFKDQPLGVPNEVPLYLMSKELKKDITVVMSGEGADEIFSGYGRLFSSPFDYARLRYISKLPRFIRKTLFKKFDDKYGDRKTYSDLDHFMGQYSYFPLREKKSLFNDFMNSEINNDEFLRDIFVKEWDKLEGKSYYEKIPYVFEKLHLPGLLRRVDNSTMAASVEARVPFIDHRLVELALSIPKQHKIKWKSKLHWIKSWLVTSDEFSEKNDITKHVLREAFREYLPEEVLTRKKQGFPVPLDIWFKGDFIQFAQDLLLRKDAKIKLFINQQRLGIWIKFNVDEGKDKHFGQKLWMLLNLELWMRKYF